MNLGWLMCIVTGLGLVWDCSFGFDFICTLGGCLVANAAGLLIVFWVLLD